MTSDVKNDQISLCDALDRLLSHGISVSGDIVISVAGVSCYMLVCEDYSRRSTRLTSVQRVLIASRPIYRTQQTGQRLHLLLEPNHDHRLRFA